MLCSMHTTCIALHVVQPSAVLADTAIRLIVETQPVSVGIDYTRAQLRAGGSVVVRWPRNPIRCVRWNDSDRFL